MLNISIGDKVHSIKKDKQSIIIDNKKVIFENKETHPGVYSVIHKGKRHDIEIITSDDAFKNVTLKINGKKLTLEAKTKLDQLLEQLGMGNTTVNTDNLIKAPMPGKILELMCKEGDEVIENDNLIILEAMKMENILKAPISGKVTKIDAKVGNSVNKGHILIEIAQ